MKLTRVLAGGLALVGCLAFGFTWRDLQRGEIPSSRAIGTLFGVKMTPKGSPEQVFNQSYQRILASYVHPLKAQELKYAAMEGLMASLGDPHTMFFPPKAAQEFSESTRANFYGVGARLSADPLGAKAADVFEDGPAFAAGLKKNDVITAVDGKSVSGMAIDDIVAKIKGPEGTPVRLSLAREGHAKTLDIKVVRARIITPTVTSNFFTDTNIGYMTISQFAEPTTIQFVRELQKLERNPMKGLVIDLRGNPGGLLETAVDMLSLFVENKVAVTMRFRDGHQEVATTSSGSLHRFTYPIVILIDEDSASAAEIFSGVLNDYGKVTLVGTHSYGKASVQNVFPMVDNSSAKITIAKYYLPYTEFIGRKVDEDGVFISGGLQPKVKVDLDWDKYEPELGNPKKDSQLAKAIEVLQEKGS